MSTNDTLMDQCRREAEEKYGIQYNALRNRWRVVGDPDTVDWMLDKHNAEVKCETLRAVHAAALYAERSKPRLTVPATALAELGKKMRAAQVAYFRSYPKDRDLLEESKRLEREFDRAVEAVLDPPKPDTQVSMFDDQEVR